MTMTERCNRGWIELPTGKPSKLRHERLLSPAYPGCAQRYWNIIRYVEILPCLRPAFARMTRPMERNSSPPDLLSLVDTFCKATHGFRPQAVLCGGMQLSNGHLTIPAEGPSPRSANHSNLEKLPGSCMQDVITLRLALRTLPQPM